jgi:tetraacyldisaccharide 4'-kinase
LVLLSLLYRGLSLLHRYLYSSGILNSRSLPRPSISVGNIVVGGGGKTPLTMWLAEKLMASGVRVAILTRGYGRVHGGFRLVEPGDSWQSVGDEPALMASKISGLTIAVSKNRYKAAIKVLERCEVDLFLLDDGFQHYALKRDLDIVVIDGRKRFGSGRVLPAGILREPVSSLKKADLIVVTRTQRIDPEFERYLKGHTAAPIFWADYQPMELSPVSPAEPPQKEGDKGGSFVAFCGIAGPDGFRDSLARAGIEVAELLAFPDHHPFSVSDMDTIVGTAVERQAAALVTTEKDAVRWPHRKLPLPVYSLPVQPVVEGEEEILERILDLVT